MKILKSLLIFIVIISWLFNYPPSLYKNLGGQGWPAIWQNPRIPPVIKEAQAIAAPAFQAFSAIAASTGADVTVTLPAHAANDIFLIEVVVRDVDDTITWPDGWTQIATVDRGTTARYWWAWKRAASSAETNPLVDKSTATGDTYAAVITYRGAITTGDPWEVKGTPQTSTADPVVLTGITTLTANSLVVAAVAGEDNNNASIITTGTDPSAYVEHYVESATGTDGVITFSEAALTTAGATGNISVNWNTANPVGSGGIVLALIPPRIINLGDGTDPGPSTVAPGSTSNYLDQFTLVADYGTDSVTALTVTTVNTTAVASMQIWNEAMTTQYFTTVSSPAGNDWSFSGGTAIPVSNSSASFRVVFTAQSHASLATGTYAVTGTVTSYTCTNSKTGTDADSATITVDNSPPADVTEASGSAGNGQVSLSWTNPSDSDFHSTVVLRRANTAVGDTPVEGTTYSVGNTIGSSTVACVVLSPTASCTDSGLTNGTPYHYKIFTRDNSINYSTPGVVPSGSPFTPAAAGPDVTAPASVSMSSYQLGGVGYNDYTFAAGELVAVTNGGSGGWSLTVSSTNMTGTKNTITNANILLRTDGTLATEPTIISSSDSLTGVTETTSGNYSLDSTRTIVTASAGNGIGTYNVRPTIRVNINNYGTYAETDTATLTFTVQ